MTIRLVQTWCVEEGIGSSTSWFKAVSRNTYSQWHKPLQTSAAAVATHFTHWVSTERLG